MTDAEKAYQIAEQRIARAQAEALAYLCLAETPDTSDPVKWEDEEALTHLATIPPSISSLTELKRLDLDGTQVTDLSPLAGMVAMQTLTLNRTQVADLTPLAGMAGMQTLRLDNTQVADLTPLAGMVEMQTLSLNRTQVADLTPLAGMAGMQTLRLDNTQVADLTPLAGMAGMQTLRLDKTQVADLGPLVGLDVMRILWLSDTHVADLGPLAGLVGMQRLYLGRTQVADLTPLAGIAGMQRLWLSGTHVTDLSALVGMVGMQALWLKDTQADLSTLVAPGAAWEREDLELRKIRYSDVPVKDEVLAALGDKSVGASVGPETLARLRELRDMAPPPAAVRDPAPTGPFVFLSYAHTDRPAAFRLKLALEEEGLSIWWDQMIDPGMDWDAELRRRVTSAHSVLVLWSEASAASEHVRDEAQRARRANTIAPVMIEPLSEDQLPQPFGGRHTLDLSHWDGARDDEVFQRLVKFLKHREAGADSPLTVDATEDGDIRLRERPVGAAPEREDDVTRDRLIGAQVKLAERTAAQARRAPNAPPDLPDRLDEYVEELKADGDKFWEVIDDAFAPAAGLLKPEELTDDGLANAARRLLDRHRDLRTYIQPMQPADKPPRKDEVEPDKAEILIPDLRATRELAAHPDLPQIGPAIPRVLDTAAEHIEEEAANLPRNDTEAEQRRTRVGRALQNAIGVATGLATAMTYHSYAFSEAGKALLGKLDKLIDELVKLLP